MLWESMRNGMAASLWVIGFMVALGVFCLIVGGVCWAMLYVFGEDNENGESDIEAGDTGDLAGGDEPVGRHLHKDT